jgi:uncharacterized membrane-anchored protein
MTKTTRLPYKVHPLRETIYNELHIRPFHVVSSPQQITHLVSRAQKQEQEQAFDHLCELCTRYNVHQPAPGSVTFKQDFGEFTIHWERHVEFYSITILRPGKTGDEPFDHPAIELLPTDWLAELTGEVVAAFHVVIDDGEYSDKPDDLCRYFEGQRLVISKAKGGKALIYTAFRIHGDGYGRFIIQDKGMPEAQMGRLSRRVLEMESYRLLAQLSLPLAKQIAPQLVEMDRKLAEMLAMVPQLSNSTEERELLQKLARQEARLETWRAETNRRFSGSKAYHEMVKQRLERLAEAQVEGHPTLSEFMDRRLSPALRTCESVHNWMEDLSRRIERASDLLRTRVNLTLQEQNQSLLESMDRRSMLQFRLQETVEGLSVVAVSYYLVGLVSYLLNGLPLKQWHLSKPALLAASIPVVLFSVWWLIRRIKHRLIKKPLGDMCVRSEE